MTFAMEITIALPVKFESLLTQIYQLHNPCNQFLSFTSVNVSKLNPYHFVKFPPSLGVFVAQAERMVLEHQFHS